MAGDINKIINGLTSFKPKFEKLAKNNGLNVSVDFNVRRAWFNDKDFLMSINTRKEFQSLDVI